MPSIANIIGGNIKGAFHDEFRFNSETVTTAGNRTLEVNSPPLQYWDPNGAGRNLVLPAEADSDGLVFMVVNRANAAEDITVQNDALATVEVVGQNESGWFFCDGTTWTGLVTTVSAGMAAADVTLADAGASYAAAEVEAAFAEIAATTGAAIVGLADAGTFTAATDVEAALAELYQHLFSAQAFIPIGLHSLRLTTAMDVGNTVANGGVPSSNTTPVMDAIDAATDGAQRLFWVLDGVEQVTFQTPLPPDLDVASDVVVHFRIVSGGTTDAVGFTLASYFNEGDTAVADTSGTNQTATYAEVTATIGAADVPAGAQTLTVGLTPVAHGTDSMAMTAVWIEYTKVLLTA